MSAHSGGQLNACQHCPAKFKNKMSLDDHIMKKHPDLIASVTSEILQCSHCAYKTTVKMYLNRHMLIHSNGMYTPYYSCKHCEVTFRIKRSLDDHIVKKHPDFSAPVFQIFKCPNCEYKTTIRCYLKMHMSKHPEMNVYVCAQCNKVFKGKSTLNDHVSKKHAELATVAPSRMHQCTQCSYRAANKKHVIKHMLIHPNAVFESIVCKHCNTSFRSSQGLDNHIIQKHPKFIASVKRKIHKCTHCTYKTIYKYHFREHMLTHSSTECRHCNHCDTTYKTKKLLDDHVLKKHPDFVTSVAGKIYNCLCCAYKTTVIQYFNRHLSSHSSDVSNVSVCDYCGAQFKRKRSLDDHIVKKHPDFSASVSCKVHECPNCDYKTAQKIDLDRHILKHPEAVSLHNLISCKHCNMSFKSQQSLRNHIIRQHPDLMASVTGKIHECSNCDYKTTKKDNLDRHTLKHSGGPKDLISCQYCDATYKGKQSLDYHIVKKHPDFIGSVNREIYKCSICPYTNLRKYMLEKHMLRHASRQVTCLYCNATFKSKRVLDDHIINKHQLILSRRRRRKVHECSHCPYKTTYKRNFNQHVWIHTSRTFSTCQHCTMTFRSRPSLYDHIIREHPQFSASVNRKIYECSYCNYKTINNFIFNEHTSIHTEHCEATFKKKQSLDEHIVRKHPDFIASIARKILECPNCTFKSTSRFMLNEHLMQRSRQNSSCERCSATFKSKQSLYDHILKRHPDFSASVPYKHECPNCDYKTSKKDAFERHLLQHPKATDGSKVVSCHHCDTTYTSKERLGNHIIKEHPDLLASFKGRIYECLYCTYKTAIKHYLTTHTRMHCMDEVNVCKHCDATFKRKISLCDHIIKKHPDLRASFPYKIQECSHCDYKTARKSDLDRHMMKHLDKSSNRNLDTCLHCNATYKSKRYLHDHIVKKHPDFIATVTSKIYNCPRCTFKTTRKDELKKHILMESV
nr:unnamed protein product [Callosobruchus chinensis]